ncbi:MAG: hypothetical protein FJ303_04745 [Planctomycetes bacterium]|nr:hypothetical protein [Planctomycetota bacterium]
MPSTCVRTLVAVAFAFTLVSAAGCGGPKWGGAVSGTVTIGKELLPSGAVTFIGADGEARNAEIVNGRYEIPQPPFGLCQITVMTAPEVDETTGKAKSGGKYVEIPARYSNPNESGLTFTITEQPQNHDINLTR